VAGNSYTFNERPFLRRNTHFTRVRPKVTPAT
jgi:hypothetical protein